MAKPEAAFAGASRRQIYIMKIFFYGDSIFDFFSRYLSEDSYRIERRFNMRKRAFSTLLLLSLFIALTLGNAFAYNDSPITVTVPFDFVVGKKTLPAGVYTIREHSASGPGATLLIQSPKNKVAIITGTQPFQLQTGKAKPKLEFTHHQGQYFLSCVQMPGAEFGRRLRIRNREAEVAKAVVETVSIQN